MDVWLLISALCVLLLLVDEAILDSLSLFCRLGPSPFPPPQTTGSVPLAVIVANWQEASVLESMVATNVRILQSPKHHIFLGVYPNDSSTLKLATALAKKYAQVHTVINRLEGPTNKGQMLDEIIDGVLKAEDQLGFRFSGFVIHDAEDVIAPESLPIYESLLDKHAFVQLPVLSLPLRRTNCVGGTYMDEFAESHSKDMLVRQRLHTAIPSAGVGTALARKLILYFRATQGGRLFPEADLTEDYILGMKATLAGFSSYFACFYSPKSTGKRLIATREYFPSTLSAAIRQKSRWTMGIAYQGWRKIDWFGSFWQRYFLWRDRKAVFIPFVTLNSLAVVLVVLLNPAAPRSVLFFQISSFNMLLILFRLALRVRWVHRHHGAYSAATAPLRWPLALAINTASGIVALWDFCRSELSGVPVPWKKTEHRFPPVASSSSQAVTPQWKKGSAG